MNPWARDPIDETALDAAYDAYQALDLSRYNATLAMVAAGVTYDEATGLLQAHRKPSEGYLAGAS